MPLMEIIVLKPSESDVGIRLDKYVSDNIEDVSRSFLKIYAQGA